jgi:hypothetical protein
LSSAKKRRSDGVAAGFALVGVTVRVTFLASRVAESFHAASARGRLEAGAEGGIRRGARGDRQRETDFGVAGHADVFAHQPLGGGFERDARAGREIGGRRQGDRQEQIAFVAVADDRTGAVLEGFGRGPLNLAGFPAGRERPRDRGDEAGPWVEPIRVPMFVVDEAEGDLHRFAGDDGGLSGDERSFDVRARHEGQQRGEAEREEGKERETGESHNGKLEERNRVSKPDNR